MPPAPERLHRDHGARKKKRLLTSQLVDILLGMRPKTVGAFEAKTHFSALIHAAENGQTFVVTKNGKPVAQIGPVAEQKAALTPQEAVRRLFSIKARRAKIDLRELIEEGRRF